MKKSEVYIPEFDVWLDYKWDALEGDPAAAWAGQADSHLRHVSSRFDRNVLKRVTANPVLTTTERALFVNLWLGAVSADAVSDKDWAPVRVDIQEMSNSVGVKVQHGYRLLVVLMSFNLIRKVSSDVYMVNMAATGLFGDSPEYEGFRWQDIGTWRRGTKSGYWLTKDGPKVIKGWRELVLMEVITPDNYEQMLYKHVSEGFLNG